MSTETIDMKALKVGDTITGIDATEFPFPFVLNDVTPLVVKGKTLAVKVTATHGWFGIMQPHFRIHRAA